MQTETPRHAFTGVTLNHLAPGQIVRDTLVPGLHARGGRTRASFFLYFRTKSGIERRPKLGDVGIITIPQARELARALLVEVAAGRDPMAERAQARSEPTLDDVFARCVRDHWNRGTAWDREAARLYRTCLAPALGSARVVSIRYPQIETLHRSLAATPRQANRAVAVLSHMLNLAERLEFRPLNSNPCPRLARYPEVARRRYATLDELRRLGAVLRTYAIDFPREVTFLKMLLYTGARPSELLRASRTCLEARPDGMGVLRIVEGKTGQRTVFLPPQVMRSLTCFSPFRTTLTGLTAMPTRLWHRIREEAGCPDLWARDCRRTFATVGYSEGVSLEQMADILGHTDQQTTRVYAKLMEDPAARAVAATAGTMERLLSAG